MTLMRLVRRLVKMQVIRLVTRLVRVMVVRIQWLARLPRMAAKAGRWPSQTN